MRRIVIIGLFFALFATFCSFTPISAEENKLFLIQSPKRVAKLAGVINDAGGKTLLVFPNKDLSDKAGNIIFEATQAKADEIALKPEFEKIQVLGIASFYFSPIGYRKDDMGETESYEVKNIWVNSLPLARQILEELALDKYEAMGDAGVSIAKAQAFMQAYGETLPFETSSIGVKLYIYYVNDKTGKVALKTRNKIRR